MIFLLVPLSWVFGFVALSETDVRPSPRYEGLALERTSGLPVYKEEHEDILESGKRTGLRTIYRDMRNNIIAKRIVSYKESETVPTFQTEDFRDGYLEGAGVRGDSVRLYWRRNFDQAMQEKTILIPGPAVVDAGFNNLIQQHWDELFGGKKIQFNFGAPFALDYYGFRVFKKDEMVFEGRQQIVMQCEIDNFIIRLFVKPIVLTYDAESRRLVAYEGISNINNDKGKSYFVRIQFHPFGP